MKKTVRLTESDLVRLVKKVIKEQDYKNIQNATISKLGYKRIDKIGIWGQMEGTVEKVMLDVFAKREKTQGCKFLLVPRSKKNVWIIDFKCHNPTKLESHEVDGDKEMSLIISKEAGNRLINACGCKDYVRTDMSSSGQDYV
jgi:hypothetical protein